MNGGTCTDRSGYNFSCSCPFPYSGQRCQGNMLSRLMMMIMMMTATVNCDDASHQEQDAAIFM